MQFRTAGGRLVRLNPGALARRRGLGALGQAGGFSVSALASAIQQVEGYYPPGTPGYPQGSLSYRNNNPGNIRPGSLAVGATGSNGGYAVFPDYQTGWNALVGLIQSPAYWGLTLTQFFSRYAPSADNNNPAAYAATVAASLGVDADTPLSQLASGGGTTLPGSGGVCDPTDPSYDPTQCTATASTSAVASDPISSIADAFAGVPGWLLAAAGGLLLLAAAL